ncbi:MAG: hypothetical protein FJZ38_25890 [Candidatus Rokubacteria bacterium]|nr:hypothetical protein [Candidatus Rokubacteria bacterium]
MKVVFRAVAVLVMLSLAGAGPLASLAAAQQPVAPQMFQEDVKPAAPQRGMDVYDVGAVAATAAGFPFKIAICAIGTAVSIVTFAGTFGTRPDASAAILHEGCGGSKTPWIVRGSDIRPRPTVSKAFDWETHRFNWEQQ